MSVEMTGGAGMADPCTLHPAPCTLHPAPCTPTPDPCTLHPAPCTTHRLLLTPLAPPRSTITTGLLTPCVLRIYLFTELIEPRAGGWLPATAVRMKPMAEPRVPTG